MKRTPHDQRSDEDILLPIEDLTGGGLRVTRVHFGIPASHIGRKYADILFCLSSINEIYQSTKRFPVDIIHVHGDIIEATIIGGYGKTILGKPVVLTLHAGLSRKSLYTKVAPFAFGNIAAFIAVSEEVKKNVCALGIPEGKVSVISSGIDLSEFSASQSTDRHEFRKRFALPESIVLITFLGRLHALKGLKYLVATAASLKNRNDIHFLIIGDGPERIRLMRQAQGLHNITFLSSLEHSLAIRALHSADIFVLPSIELEGQSEGTPTAVLEAMAAGLPIISTDKGGTKAIIDNKAGLTIVPQKDSLALCHAISKMASDPKLRVSIGRMNRIMVQCRDWPRIADQVCSVYEKVL